MRIATLAVALILTESPLKDPEIQQSKSLPLDGAEIGQLASHARRKLALIGLPLPGVPYNQVENQRVAMHDQIAKMARTRARTTRTDSVPSAHEAETRAHRPDQGNGHQDQSGRVLAVDGMAAVLAQSRSRVWTGRQ